MKNIAHFDTVKYGWQRMLSIITTLAAFVVITFAMSGCFHDDDDAVITPAPGQPTNFTVTRPGDALLTAELAWSVPSTGGDPVSYEIFRSTTAGTVFQDDNQIFSIPAEDGKTTYTYTDNVGLTNVETYWVVAAKNAGGETPTAEVMFRPIGPPGGVGDTGYGNNFAAALFFADDIGISGLSVTGPWTTDLTTIDVNTGLRPSADEVSNLLAQTVPVTTLPYLDPTTEFIFNSETYYKQQTVSTWQGQWENGSADNQHVSAKWGDNLTSQNLTVNSTIRIEMVLSKTLTTSMTSYLMQSLYGTRVNEMVGTDGTTYDNLSAFVFASNARLMIQKLDANGDPDGAPLYNQNLWEGSGPGFLAGEINVAGNFTYGFVWNLKNQTLPGDITTGKAGTWRITFSLDSDNTGAGMVVPLAANNTFIDSAINGVRVSDTEAYIDISVLP